MPVNRKSVTFSDWLGEKSLSSAWLRIIKVIMALLKNLSFLSALLLAPLAYQIHHIEEHIIYNFRAWRLLYFADNNPLSTEAVLAIVTATVLVFIFLYSLLRNKATAQAVVLLLMATQVHNVLFHLGGTIVFQHFSPGLITALALYLPVNILIVIKGFAEGWLTVRSLAVLFVLGGLSFWCFELFGSGVMRITVLALIIWTIWWTLRNKQTV